MVYVAVKHHLYILPCCPQKLASQSEPRSWWGRHNIHCTFLASAQTTQFSDLINLHYKTLTEKESMHSHLLFLLPNTAFQWQWGLQVITRPIHGCDWLVELSSMFRLAHLQLPFHSVCTVVQRQLTAWKNRMGREGWGGGGPYTYVWAGLA